MHLKSWVTGDVLESGIPNKCPQQVLVL